MSGRSTPSGTPKSMSSRLLTMKFMQRAAAIPLPPSPGSPDDHSPRRQKTGASTPPTFDVSSLVDHRAIQAARELEEAKRQAAIDKAAAAAGETRWTLNFEHGQHQMSNPPIRVVQTGFAALDQRGAAQVVNTEDEDDVEQGPAIVGRQSFGRFNRQIEKMHGNVHGEESDSSSDEDEDQEDESESGSEDDPMDTLIKQEQGSSEAAKLYKAERAKKLRAERKQAVKLAKERKKKTVNMNSRDLDAMPSSISGGQRKGPGGVDRGPCFNCGQVGHMKADCPKSSRKRRRDGT